MLLIIFDPVIEAEGKTLSKIMQWGDPRITAQTLIKNLNESRGRKVQSTIVDTIATNEFPPRKGFGSIGNKELLACLRNLGSRSCSCQTSRSGQPACSNQCQGGTAGKKCDAGKIGRYGEHPECIGCLATLDTDVDHIKFFDKFSICEKVNDDKVDEVWVAAYPYSGFGESDMVGPNPFLRNGSIGNAIKYDKCKKNVLTVGIDMNLSYNQDNKDEVDGAAVSALHSLGHRIESTMSYVYGSQDEWKFPPRNNWESYVITGSQSEIAACGNIHAPPNIISGAYNYSDSRTIKSYCKSFLNYPDVSSNQTESVSCQTWGCSSLGYYKWWMDHIPNKPGRGPDGKLNNWWEYIYNNKTARRDSETEKIHSVDLNQDNTINALDIALLYKNWGANVDWIDVDVAPGRDKRINALDVSYGISNLGKSISIITPHIHQYDSSGKIIR